MEPLRGKAAYYARLNAKAEKAEAELKGRLAITSTKYQNLMHCENNFSQNDAYARHILLEDYSKAVLLMSRHISIRKEKRKSTRVWPDEPEAKAREMYSFICEYRTKVSKNWSTEWSHTTPLIPKPVENIISKSKEHVQKPGFVMHVGDILPAYQGEPKISGQKFTMRGTETQVLHRLLVHQAMKHSECIPFDNAQLEAWKSDVEGIPDKATVIAQCFGAIREWEKPKKVYIQAMQEERYSDALEVRRQISYMRLLGIFNCINLDDCTDIEKWARNAERGVFNRSLEVATAGGTPCNWESREFRRIHGRTHMKVVSSLIFCPNRSSVISRLEGNVIKPQDIAFMTPEELDPEAAEARRKFEEWKSRASKVNLDDYSDGMYSCPRCKCRKTDYTERQTRSADEPMTVFLFCLACNKRWRM